MNNYIAEHMSGLEDIATCCGLDFDKVARTYSLKQMDYLTRDLHLGNPVGFSIMNKEYADRAYKVMSEYAVRKLNYKTDEQRVR